MHFRKLADHLRHKIGFAEEGSAFSLSHICFDKRREFFGKRDKPLNALMLRAELCVKSNRFQFFKSIFKLHLEIGFPEKLSVRQSCAHNFLIAADDGCAIIFCNHIGSEKKFIGERIGSCFAQHKTFLIGAYGGADHLWWNVKEALFKRAHEHGRPFDKPCDFFKQRIIFNKLEPLRESETLCVIQNNVFAAIGRENHFGGF